MKKKSCGVAEIDFKMDGHKLALHPGRVQQWLEGKRVFPVYAEVGLHSSCNHRCIFCSFDYLGHRPVCVSERKIRSFIVDAAKSGIKAILYSGEGEPFLHERAAEIIAFTKQKGIDVAVSTNGVLLNVKKLRKILRHLTWIRISLNAGKSESYGLVHGAHKDDFSRVLKNIKTAVRIKSRDKLGVSIGVQCVLLRQNYKEIYSLAATLKAIGIDYFTVKPYSFHPLSLHDRGSTQWPYRELVKLNHNLKSLETKAFQIIFRIRAMQKIDEPKPYGRCLGFPFVTHIAASGDISPCNYFVGQKKYVLGNINKKKFSAIWRSKKKQRIISGLYETLDVSKCRQSCRLDEINRYLWELAHPGPHVNFI